ncbi:MAG TPA: hypothetical protein VGU27_12735 [Candidatus Eisenbacteria bacterium]|nr:hypothetical protein [Candidatus Eisenbacteria bacterium]
MSLNQPTTRRIAGQTIVVPDVAGAAAQTFADSHPAAKLVIVLAIIFLGLELYGRWTGHYVGRLDLLGRNAIGEQINASQQTLSQQRAGQGGAGFWRVHSQ